MSPVEAALETLAHNMGITVIETSNLGCTLNACFHPPTRTIFIKTGLDPVTRHCAIAHELGHAHYGHGCSTPGAERQADEWAARQLLDVGDVEAVGWECEGSAAAMAAELGVTPHLLTLWMRMYVQGRIQQEKRAC
ncbi:ImmA/IrrE family metallo-endopeptidase [Corynebacterium silvaticum]|uniref:ImmA/IrrE family metallo-endopeptidase n=1 Tax=Corynebacterium silvaticum TaxID=2320431 RepID=UPI0010689C64|nr:ImmA/IrrE family metallo-endopeptidase [Corynebacterium silvaticum]MBH5301130.1 ImmA/IrrE family metallo-endopeptidase [Corynebacterium silvaticum]NOM65330.1 ImmA/IrrE family metallo-endopeptidase [Corynebacterium silvaticum]NON70968.1 ImmA/IrrE family metallo-endopeptidase [Corynebacterium silvaticum]TFA92661.1 ImmA/IrrE family metallo-endopeptidase [Corynebacterium silvaticum]TFA96346.1 ImmA/IrrE family metallo-endopeptidase [Corynebacterium silvaticum]